MSLPLVGLAAVLSLAALGSFLGVGCMASRKVRGLAVHGAPGVAFVNGSSPSVWYVVDNYVLDGGFRGCMGKEVRAVAARRNLPAMAFTRDWRNVPADAEHVVYAGQAAADFLEAWKAGKVAKPAGRTVFLSPPFAASEVPSGLREACSLQLVQGEFAERLTNGANERPEWLRVVPGALLYIPGWMRF